MAETDAVFHPATQFRAQFRAHRDEGHYARKPQREGDACCSRPRRSDEPIGGSNGDCDDGADAGAARAANGEGHRANIGGGSRRRVRRFVVLTAWEEVQTTSPRTRAVADYEARRECSRN